MRDESGPVDVLPIHPSGAIPGSNPLVRYRAAQLRVRALFNPFTAVHCATCETPCCVEPARIRPVDLVLVEELGLMRAGRPAQSSASSLILHPSSFELAPELNEPTGTRCRFLSDSGCVFPADLRPYGCAAFICDPMRRLLPPEELARVEAAVAELDTAHDDLMAALHS